MGPVNHMFSTLCHFEQYKDNIRIFTSKKNTDNHFLVFLFGLNSQLLRLLKTKVNSFFLTLIDIIGLDLSRLKNYNLFFNTDTLQLESKFFERLIGYNTLDYNTNSRYIILSFINSKETIDTLEYTFSNSNWLERELVEFFNINILNRKDTRNLLLDYNSTANPLLKTYPTEGHQEIFFNHLFL